MARSNSGAVVGIAIAAGGLWYLMTRKAGAATPAVQITSPGVVGAPAAVPGALAPTASTLTATQAVWANLTVTTGPTSGYVNFPTGSQAPAGFLSWATDGSGNYYTQWAGQIYIVDVAAPDANGNYPAKQLGT